MRPGGTTASWRSRDFSRQVKVPYESFNFSDPIPDFQILGIFAHIVWEPGNRNRDVSDHSVETGQSLHRPSRVAPHPENDLVMRPYRSGLEAAHQAFIGLSSLAGVLWAVSEIAWRIPWSLLLYLIGLVLVMVHFSSFWDRHHHKREERRYRKQEKEWEQFFRDLE